MFFFFTIKFYVNEQSLLSQNSCLEHYYHYFSHLALQVHLRNLYE